VSATACLFCEFPARSRDRSYFAPVDRAYQWMTNTNVGSQWNRTCPPATIDRIGEGTRHNVRITRSSCTPFYPLPVSPHTRTATFTSPLPPTEFNTILRALYASTTTTCLRLEWIDDDSRIYFDSPHWPLTPLAIRENPIRAAITIFVKSSAIDGRRKVANISFLWRERFTP